VDVVERCEGGVGLLLQLGGEELVEDRVGRGAVAWPLRFVNPSVQKIEEKKVSKGGRQGSANLRIQTCLRPQLRFLNCGEVVLYECEVIVGQCSITGEPWGATALWLVGKVKSIAPGKEV
jgi:hypothetical protein